MVLSIKKFSPDPVSTHSAQNVSKYPEFPAYHVERQGLGPYKRLSASCGQEAGTPH